MNTLNDTFSHRVWLLGALRVENPNGLLRVSGSKVQSLFAFLLLHPRTAHTREYLADLLWPEAPPDRVRRSFSDTLYRLRQALGQAWLVVEPDKVSLNPEAELWVDVWKFEQLLEINNVTTLTQAVDLYTGDLLPEIYDDWILTRRVNLHEQYLNTLEKLVEMHQAESDLPQALKYARRLITIEPLRENNQQTYLRLLGRLQHRNEALVHYDYLQQLLQQELGVDPLPETRTIVEAIRREAALPDSATPSAERTPFVGRVQERATLLEAVEAAIAGQGGLLAVEGEAGIGKSRLLREAAAGARWRGAAIMNGSATEQPTAFPLSPLIDALAEHLAEPRLAQLETLLPPQTLARLAPLHPLWGELADLPDLPPEQARTLFHQALTELFQTVTRLKPSVLILDDLHWADSALFAALAALLPQLSQIRLLLLLAYRRPEIEQGGGWQTLQQWQREGQLKTITLHPLAEAEVAQILPLEFQDEAQHLTASSGGNPFYVTEMLTALSEGRSPHGDTVLARADKLPREAHSVLEAAAVLGTEIPYRLWATIADQPPYLLAEASEQLVAGNFLQPRQTGYAFIHDLVHATIYDQMAPARRQRLHRQAADSLARLAPDNLRTRAFHLDRAAAQAEAAVAYRQAGEQDLALFAFREAQLAFDRALELMSSKPTQERVETLLALARVCDVTGDRVRQEVALNEARQSSPRLADDDLLTEALLISGQVAAQTGKIEAAATYLHDALGLAKRRANESQEIEAISLLGDLAARQGQFKEAKTRFETALQQAQKAKDRQREARALRGLGIVARQSGQIEQAVSWLEKALAVQQQINDRYGASVTQANILGGLYYLGAWDRLMVLAEEALAIKEELGDRLGAAIVRQQRGLAVYALGDFETARRLLNRVIEDCEAVGERRTLGLTRNVLGLVAESEGDLAEARGEYEAALAIAEGVGATVEAAYAQHDLGALYCQMDEYARAMPLLEAAHAIWSEQNNKLLRLKSETYLGLARLGLGEQVQAEALAQTNWEAFQAGIPGGEQPQAWLWTLYRLLEALPQPAQANQVLQAAYDELQRQARVIKDAEMRRSFFEQVPLNRKIVAAYDRQAQNVRQVTVTLARQDAPLGRSLRPEEMVTIQWTVSAPEDETIGSKSVCRRHRLRRLLEEATAQGAAPTDDDLAKALAVSRRTILRDMELLAQSGLTFPTRRRK